MAAITTVITTHQRHLRVETKAAAVNPGTTINYVAVPAWAQSCIVYDNLTSISANSHQLLLYEVPADLLDDSYRLDLATVGSAVATSVARTAASLLVVHVGPGVSGIADNVTNSATVSTRNLINRVLPEVLGISTVNGAATMSYTVSIHFRGK